MKRIQWSAIFAGMGMLILIMDAETALEGASEGIELCIRVVIPSLLPFFFLSNILTSSLCGSNIPILGPLCRFTGIPKGGEGLLLLGFLGGYPVGAQSIAASYRDGQLAEFQAKRLLCFCSNAGPSFLFGIVASKFSQTWIPWLLWAIHIFSALLTGYILPNKTADPVVLEKKASASPVTALQGCLRIMASVCGWIILFRILIRFLQQWILWLLPQSVQILITGLLELTNGCNQLDSIDMVGLRFIMASLLLSFGGLCVTMQTASAVGPLGIGSYLKGKLLQTLFSTIMSFLIQLFFPAEQRIEISGTFAAMFPVILAFFAVILRESEKRSSVFSGNHV